MYEKSEPLLVHEELKLLGREGQPRKRSLLKNHLQRSHRQVVRQQSHHLLRLQLEQRQRRLLLLRQQRKVWNSLRHRRRRLLRDSRRVSLPTQSLAKVHGSWLNLKGQDQSLETLALISTSRQRKLRSMQQLNLAIGRCQRESL
jgi:hypothetical protein